MLADFMHMLIARESDDSTPVVRLFGGPCVSYGRQRVTIPEGSKRLLVFVALHRGRVERRYAAGTLWPVRDDFRAAGNLRSALWRLNGIGVRLLKIDKHGLAMRDDVLVDLHVVGAWATRLIRGSASGADLEMIPSGVDAIDLLPGWYDDWVLMERERVRQRLLHALEALSSQLAQVGRCAEAVDAAMMAVTAEPLRESAQRALIEAHIAEGNWVEGHRSLEAYRNLLDRELGVQPDPELASMVRKSARRPELASSDASGRPIPHPAHRIGRQTQQAGRSPR
jgi:DNA-binding SARP family transcriptional activator